MPDQAAELRKLVLRAAREQVRDSGPIPRTIVLTGGKGGTGVTTLAVNLSVAFAEQGARVVLVDADPHRADVAALCGVNERGDLSDVMSLRRDIHEVLVLGPAGIQLVPGLWAPGSRFVYSARQHDRMLKQLDSLGRHADLVVVDVGSSTHESVRKFWQHAQRIVMVTTPDDLCVMDTYATIKSLVGAGEELPIHLLVNQTNALDQSLDVHRRIDHSSRRFLGRGIGWLGSVPLDPAVVEAARIFCPFLLNGKQSAARLAVEQVATRLLADLNDHVIRASQVA